MVPFNVLAEYLLPVAFDTVRQASSLRLVCRAFDRITRTKRCFWAPFLRRVREERVAWASAHAVLIRRAALRQGDVFPCVPLSNWWLLVRARCTVVAALHAQDFPRCVPSDRPGIIDPQSGVYSEVVRGVGATLCHRLWNAALDAHSRRCEVVFRTGQTIRTSALLDSSRQLRWYGATEIVFAPGWKWTGDWDICASKCAGLLFRSANPRDPMAASSCRCEVLLNDGSLGGRWTLLCEQHPTLSWGKSFGASDSLTLANGRGKTDEEFYVLRRALKKARV